MKYLFVKYYYFLLLVALCCGSCRSPYYFNEQREKGYTMTVYKTDSVSINFILTQYHFARIDPDSLCFSVILTVSIENNSTDTIRFPITDAVVHLYDKRNPAQQTLGKLSDTMLVQILTPSSNLNEPAVPLSGIAYKTIAEPSSTTVNSYIFSFTYANKKGSKYNKKHGVKIQVPYIIIGEEKTVLPMMNFVW